MRDSIKTFRAMFFWAHVDRLVRSDWSGAAGHAPQVQREYNGRIRRQDAFRDLEDCATIIPYGEERPDRDSDPSRRLSASP